MKKRGFKRLMSTALVVSMTFGMSGVPAFADEAAESIESAVEETEAAEETEAVEETETAEETEAAEESIAAEETETAEETESETLAVEAETETVNAEAMNDVEAEPETVYEEMLSTAIGGVTYFYADTNGDDEATVYQAVVKSRQGSTTYDFTKADLTQLGETDYYYGVVTGVTPLSGTLYGYGEGNATNYREVYGDLGVSTDSDTAYDAVSSATHFAGHHAKDIPSLVTYGTDAEGNKTITGLNLGRTTQTVDALTYVEAGILRAAGQTLTAEQEAALDVVLKTNPMNAPAESQIEVKLASASYAASGYGTGEFQIVPDETVEGYVWSEYWNSVYAATISNGETTAGAVHWIDLYGEAATSGPHYNKVEIALNNGKSTASNAAAVSRYAAFYDANTGNIKPGTYTVTVYAEGYTPLTAEIEIAAEEMQTVSLGGVNYYYADTADDDVAMVYQAVVRSRQGSTTYNFTKADLTQVGETGYYYGVVPGVAPLTGTLYGYGDGNATNYKEVYGGFGVSTDSDAAYDAVSSATHFAGHHAKDIPSLVTYGTDAEGNKTITGLNLGRTTQTVDALTYVEAGILRAAGQTLTAEQEAALDVVLKTNPMNAPAESQIEVKLASASYAASGYGTGEFQIVPDETVEGYVWSEYWNSVYAATISNGETTVGAVHWIDLYGEAATAGPHYNKVEIALNNGESVASNAAAVSRYAAFYDANTGNIKPGTYTITVYAEGYSDLTCSVTVGNDFGTTIDLADKAAVYTGKAIAIDAAAVTNFTGNIEYTYFADESCQKALEGAPVNAGIYYVKAAAGGAESNVAKLTIDKAASSISLTAKNAVYTGKAAAIGKAAVKGSTGKVTYTYYSDSACTKKLGSVPVNAGTYYVKASVAADSNYKAATSKAVKLVIAKAASKVTLKAKTAVYTGKAININRAAVSGSKGKVTYTYYTDARCTKKARTHVNAGTYYVKAYVAADANYNAATSSAVRLIIRKAAQKITVSTTSKNFALKNVKEKAQVFAIGAKASGRGKLTYAKMSGSSALTINKTTGKITLKKGTRKGTYTIKVKVAAAGNANYNAANVTKIIKVIVK